MNDNLVKEYVSFGDAIADTFTKIAKARNKNEKVLATLPKNPKRGTYEWWARLCRQNTGSALCDSGLAYGYQYERGLKGKEPHIYMDVRDGKLDGVTIHLPHFLVNQFDADDDTAIALEKVLYWIGEWMYPREEWGEIIEDWPNRWDDIKEWCIEKSNSGLHFRKKTTRNKTGLTFAMEAWYDSLEHYDLTNEQQGMTKETFVKRAVDDFPIAAAKMLYEAQIEPDKNLGTFYTYNGDNDLDQDFLVNGWWTDGCDKYAIVRAHCGCDARGGFSNPVIARAYDADYVWDWQVDFYCPNREETYEDCYEYVKALAANPPLFPIDEWKSKLNAPAEIAAGQLVLDGMEPPAWKYPIGENVARAIMAYMNDTEEKDFPTVIVKGANGNPAVIEDGNITEEQLEGLYCPECGTFGVHPYSGAVFGY